MQKVSFNRRDFLRLCLLTAGGAVAAACEGQLQTVVPTATGIASPAPSVKLNLGGDQDAWTWVKQIKVGVSDGTCEKLLLRVNEQEVEAQTENDLFAADVRLAPGENQVRAVCTQPGGGETESEPVVYHVRLRPAPRAVIQIAIENGQIVLDGSQSLPSEADESAIAEYIWAAREGNPEPLRTEAGDLSSDISSESISIVPPATDGEYYLSLKVRDEAGREDTSTIYFVVENGQLRIPDYDHENAAWIEQAVVYGIVPFLFGTPAFQAITARLDELADLGITAIWLGPINAHPPDDYGYAVENYFALDPAYGSDEDFRQLVQASHQRGIRVLMDFVPNHTSNTHPYFKDAEQRGPESAYWDFYDRDENGNYTHYFDWAHLPNLNYDHPEVRRMITEAFAYWVREFDVDGFRVDVVWGVRERYPEYWPEWRRELKRIKPDLLLLAEATARESFYFENGFDAAYDWTYQPGAWAWKVVWDAYKLRLLAYNLTDALTNRPDGFHPDALIFRFLNNNDTGHRFITRYGEGVTKVATAMLFSLPGIPSLYIGDEYGLEFEPYQQVEPLVFEEQFAGLREYHKKLIELRKTIPSLYSRDWTLITPDAVPQPVYSYIRHGDPTDAPVVVLLNFSEEPATFEFDVPEEFSSLLDHADLYDLLADEMVPASSAGRMKVSVPAFTARLLTVPPTE